MLIAFAIFAFLATTSTTFLSFMQESSVNIDKKVTKKSNEEWFDLYLYKLISLNKLGISYGILNIPDDNNKNFLDFYPDYHSNHLSASDKKRTFTLQNNKKIVFLSIKDNF